MAKERKKMSTLHKRNWLRLGSFGCKGATYASPAVAVSILVGINWNEWFVQSRSGVFVGFGFLFTIISTLLTYFSIAKQKKLIEKLSAFWNVAIIVICWAIALLFLSSIASQLGYILLYIGFSLIASAIVDETETRLIEPKYEFYKGLVTEYGLDKREVRKQEKLNAKRVQAQKEAELEARKQAID